MKKLLLITLLCGVALASCETNNMDNIQENAVDYGKRTFTILSDNSDTRAVFDGTNGSLWKATDKIGVACTYGRYGYVTDETIRPFSISNAGNAETVEVGEFTGALTDKGSKTYVYYAYTPYSEGVSTENLEEVPCTLPTIQYPTATSWDSDADYMVAYPVEQTSDNVGGNNDLGFRFTRVFGMLRLSFDESWTSLYGDKVVKSVTITAGDDDKLAGEFTLDIMNEPSETSSQIVRYTMSSSASNSIKLDYTDKNILFKDLQAYFMLNSGSYESVEIEVVLDGAVITANRTNLTITRGSLLSAPVSKKVEDNVMDVSCIEITEPGTLANTLSLLGVELSDVIELKLTGTMNDVDFSTIRSMSNLVSLDLGSVYVAKIHSYALEDMTKLHVVVLPDCVTSIGDYAFRGCSSLASINIPEGVTLIGDQAFVGCSSLASITIPDSVTSIGSSAFSACSNLASISIPNSVTSIGKEAFSGCVGELIVNSKIVETDYTSNNNPYSHDWLAGSNFSKLIIGNNVEKIGNWAFSYCSSLASVTLPDDVTSIGDYAFRSCSSLTSVTIPSSVTSIGNNAFYGCSSLPVEDGLRYVGTCLIEAVDKSLSMYTIKEGTKFILNSAFSRCTNLASITIPDSVTSIGGAAFFKCSNLASINIPDSVTSIGGGAFFNCLSITSITIPEGVISIESSTFEDCSNLESITIPEGVTSIGELAFSGCSNLTRIDIGSGVTSIGLKAFRYCSNLKEVHIKDIASWCCISYPNYSDEFAILISNPLYMAKNLYYNGELVTDLVIPEGVVSISDYCMYNYDQLKSVTLPSTTEIVGMEAFDACDNLTTIYCKASTPPSLYYYVEYSADADYNDYYYYSISKNTNMEIYVPRDAYETYMQYNYSWEDAYDPYPNNWYLYKSFIKPYDFE